MISMHKKFSKILMYTSLIFLSLVIVGSSFASIKGISYLAVDVTITYEKIKNLNDLEDGGDGDYLLKLIGPGKTYTSGVAWNDFPDYIYPDTYYPTLTLHNSDFGWYFKKYSNIRIDDGDVEFKITIREKDSIFSYEVIDTRLIVKNMVSAGGTYTFSNIYCQLMTNSYPPVGYVEDNNCLFYYCRSGASAQYLFDYWTSRLYISVTLYYHWM